MANFEEFKVTVEQTPGRMGLLASLVVALIFFFNYQIDRDGFPGGWAMLYSMKLAGQDVRVVEAESSQGIGDYQDCHRPDSCMNLPAWGQPFWEPELGLSVIASVPVRLFGLSGFHILYSLLGGILALLIHGLVLEIFGRQWLAILGQAIACLNPVVLSYQGLQSNLLAIVLVAAIMYLAVRKEPAYLLIGLFSGFLVVTRPPAMLYLPLVAILLISRTEQRRLKRLGGLVVLIAGLMTTLVFMIPWSSGDWPSAALSAAPNDFLSPRLFAYELFGFKFNFPGLLGYPFADQVIRTPHYPFPTFLTLPMSMAGGLGILLSALFFMGISPLSREEPKLVRFFLAWMMATLLFFGVQEDWDDYKMAGLMLVIPAATVLMASGLVRFTIFSGFKGSLVTYVFTIVVLVTLINGAVFMFFPKDLRWEEKYSNSGQFELPSGNPQVPRLSPEIFRTAETPDEYLESKREYCRANLLPRFYHTVRWDTADAIADALSSIEHRSLVFIHQNPSGIQSSAGNQ